MLFTKKTVPTQDQVQELVQDYNIKQENLTRTLLDRLGGLLSQTKKDLEVVDESIETLEVKKQSLTEDENYLSRNIEAIKEASL